MASKDVAANDVLETEKSDTADDKDADASAVVAVPYWQLFRWVGMSLRAAAWMEWK